MSKKKKVAKALTFYAVVGILIALVIGFLPRILNLTGYVLWLFAPFIIAYGISLLVNPMADGLQKRFRLPRGISAVLVIVLTVGVLGGIVTGIIWKIVDEIRNVYEDLPVIYMDIRATWLNLSKSFSGMVSVLPEAVQTAFESAFESASDQFLKWLADIATNTELMRSAGNFAKRLPNIFIVLVVFILSLYFMVADSERVSAAVKKPFSSTVAERMSEFRMQIKKYVGGYIKAQLIIMCISFTLLLIGLSILRIDYALVIALATAVFDALPLFGSGAVLITWSIISFITGNIINGVGLLIIYLSVVLTRQFVEPKIVSKNIGMHPILTLMAMYVGFKAFSIGGMIFGPLMLVILISFYRAGLFDGIIKWARKFFLKACREIKNITSSLDDEGE